MTTHQAMAMGQVFWNSWSVRTVLVSRERRGMVCRSFLLLLLCCFISIIAAGQQLSDKRIEQEAQQAQAAGEDDRAVSLYAKALQRDPAWTEGWWRYGGLLYEARNFSTAAVAFARLTQLSPENPLGFAMLGLCEYEQADWNNASLHLNKALNHGRLPANIAGPAMYDFAFTLLHQKNRNGALIMLRLLQHQDPKYPNLISAFGAAELNLDAIPSTDAANAGAVNLAGEASIAVLGVHSDDAEKLYQQLVRDYPNVPYAHLCLGLFLENMGKHSEAEQPLKAETVINPTAADAWIWLGRLALARRDVAETRADVAQALKVSPNDPLCYLLSGRSLVIDEKWEQARAELQKAEALAPDSYEVHYTLITVYTALHQDDQAVAERKLFSQTFSASHPDDEVVHP